MRVYSYVNTVSLLSVIIVGVQHNWKCSWTPNPKSVCSIRTAPATKNSYSNFIYILLIYKLTILINNSTTMAYKKDTRKRVKILKSEYSYLNGMIGRLQEDGVMVGPTIIPFNKEYMEMLD